MDPILEMENFWYAKLDFDLFLLIENQHINIILPYSQLLLVLDYDGLLLCWISERWNDFD